MFIVLLSILTLEFTETKCNLQNSAMLLRPATPVKDVPCRRLIAELCLDEYLSNYEARLDVSGLYQDFLEWLHGSKRVEFTPPPTFQPLMCSGITDAFHDFYIRFAQKDLFVLRGEYPYHKDVWSSLEKPIHYLDSTSLHENACVILSIPFSATGSVHPQSHAILKECSRLNVPVFLDLAFLGLGAVVSMNEFLEYSCVDTLAFSLSKMFALGRIRAGWMWTRSKGGTNYILNQWKYNNWLGHYVAQHCMRHFSFDHMSEKYTPLQRELCADLGLEPSESFLFGLGGPEYNAFSRQGTANRVCLSSLLEQKCAHLTHRGLDSSAEST